MSVPMNDFDDYKLGTSQVSELWLNEVLVWPRRLTYLSNWITDASANSMSAFYSDLDQDIIEGDFVFTTLFVYGTGGSGTTPTMDNVTQELASLAPAAPRRAFSYYTPSAPDLTVDSMNLSWTWPSTVAASSITVVVQRSGLDYWTQDWWSDGPDTAALIDDYQIHDAMIVFVWSDAGTTVAGATLIERTDPITDLGVAEAWWIVGGTGTTDIDVTALSGDIQWFTWVDIYTL